MRKVTLLLVLTASIFFSCNDDNDSIQDIDNLDGINTEINTERFEIFSGEWILLDITLNSGTKLTPPTSVDISFSIEENDSIINYNLDGTSTCNLYGGKLLSLNNNKISFEQLYSTEILCEGDLNTFEMTYFEYLFKSEAYMINGGTLTLSCDNNTINFQRQNNENKSRVYLK